MTKEDFATLKAIRDELDEHDGQGPGHAHSEPGKWDSNGKPCKWCADWRKFKELIKKLEGGGV